MPEGPLDTAQDAAAQPSPFVDEYLLYLLAAVSDRASAQFHAHVRRQGLRVPEWRVLACLHGDDGAMITHLARIALFEQSRLTRIVDQMAERGLVRRHTDPDDRRRVRVCLTETGRELAARLVSDARRHEVQVLSDLPVGDAAAIKPMLKALLAHLDPEDRGGGAD